MFVRTRFYGQWGGVLVLVLLGFVCLSLIPWKLIAYLIMGAGGWKKRSIVYDFLCHCCLIQGLWRKFLKIYIYIYTSLTTPPLRAHQWVLRSQHKGDLPGWLLTCRDLDKGCRGSIGKGLPWRAIPEIKIPGFCPQALGNSEMSLNIGPG